MDSTPYLKPRHAEDPLAEEPKQERRAFLAIALAMGVLLLWNLLFPMRPTGQRAGAPPVATSDTTAALASGAHDSTGMRAGEALSPSTQQPNLATLNATSPGVVITTAPDSAAALAERKTVRVETKNLILEVDGLGARLSAATLPGFKESDGGPVRLLPPGGDGGLGTVLVAGTERLSLDQQVFALVEDSTQSPGGERRLVWELRRPEIEFRKTFTIPPQGNRILVEQEFLREPAALTKWGLSWAGGLRSTEEHHGRSSQDYFQGSVLAEGKVQKKPLRAVTAPAIEFPGHNFFVGVQNKYFVAALVPRADQQGPVRLWPVENVDAGLSEKSVAGEILAERRSGIASPAAAYDVYIGPLDFTQLTTLGLGIEKIVDLGGAWIRPLSELLLKFLIALHNVIPNYGIVIILFSSLISLVFYPLTYKSTKSMRDLAALKPRLDELKTKHEKDPQKLSEATMKLYKEAGVNPFGGCLPLLLQMPIFFALYAVLFHTIELRGEPFFGWIRDLSQPDVVFHLPFALPFLGTGVALLPVIMGITSYIQSKQTTVDPSQKAMVILMPIVMTFVFFSFPSGLVLYWLTNNVFAIVQKLTMKPSPLVGAVPTK